MHVADILKEKGGEVTTVSPEASLLEAADLLRERGIGAVVVADPGTPRRIAGILSERDIVRRIAAEGPEALSAKVSRAMTAKVVTCSTRETVDAMMQRMTTNRFRHLPVADEAGEMIGLISIGDVVRARVQDLEREASAMRDYLANTG